MEKAQEQQAKYYNLKHKKVSYKVGNLVSLKTHIQSDKFGKVMKKLAYKWEGPFKISEVCTPLTYSLVRCSDNEPAGTHSVKNLKKYFERPEQWQNKYILGENVNPENEMQNVEKNSLSSAQNVSSYNLRSRK
jgi:hypothetical protein